MSNASVSGPGIVIAMDDVPLPGDYLLLCPWFNLIRSLRSVACTGSHAIISVHVVVDENGKPVHNTRPEATRIEPKANGEALERLLKTLVK
jgi:hypothetical protein